MLRNFFIFFIAVFIFAGCSSREVKPYVEPAEKPLKKNRDWIKHALYKEYGKFSDTPYKYGGKTTNGMDCSFLVQTVYYNAFGIKLPRATEEQVLMGYEVPLNTSKEGDLVFFKTGYKTRHSGIIIEEGKFLHTSSTVGVTISELNNPYWKSAYWQTRRIIP